MRTGDIIFKTKTLEAVVQGVCGNGCHVEYRMYSQSNKKFSKVSWRCENAQSRT